MLPVAITPGCGPERYVAKIVFELAPTTIFSELAEEGQQIVFEFAGRQVSISRRNHFYILTCGEFASAHEARTFIDLVATALLVMAARKRLGLTVNRTPSSLAEGYDPRLLNLYDPPSEAGWRTREDKPSADGATWPHLTAILPQHQQIIELQILWTQAKSPFSRCDLQHALEDSAIHDYQRRFQANPKTLLAAEAHAAAWAQSDRRIRFLNLVIVLELLSERRPVGTQTLNVIQELQQHVRTTLTKTNDAKEIVELTRLMTEVSRLRKTSITESVRILVSETFATTTDDTRERPDLTVTNIRDRITEIYAIRSRIAHELQIPEHNARAPMEHFVSALADLQYIARRVLLAQVSKNC